MANAIRPIQNQIARQTMGEGLSINAPMQAGDSVTSREMARIQGEIFMAKRFPRNIVAAQERMEQECTRITLAEKAVYVYSRGGSNVTGPSIRLAEAIARCWGNVRYGFEEVSNDGREAVVRAYAYDIEANQQAERIFTVKLGRYTKRDGYTPVTDPRDQYEVVASSAQRRVRACILEVIPGDIIDWAVELCQQTMAKNISITEDTIGKLIDAFAPYGVTPSMLEGFVQRKLISMSANQYLRLKEIYTSLRDGIGKVEDFFKDDAPRAAEPAPKPSKVEDYPTEPAAKHDAPSYDGQPGPEAFEDSGDLLEGL